VKLCKEVPEWLYRREKLPRQDVIRDVQQYGSLKHPQCQSVTTAAHIRLRIRFAKTADWLDPIKEKERRNEPSLLFKFFGEDIWLRSTALCMALLLKERE
jgi:hypothetical protein